MTPQSFCTRFQKALCAVKLLDHHYEKAMDNEEAKVIFFTPSQRNTSRTMCTIVNTTSTRIPSRISRISSKATMMLTHPKRTIVKIVEVTSANLLVKTVSLSLLVKMAICKIQLPLGPLAAPLNNPANNLVLVNIVTPVCCVQCAHNQCRFCKNLTIKWNDCIMHNPATGLQTAKDFDTMCKSAQSSKLLDTKPSKHHPASLLRREHDSHSFYNANNHHHSGECSHDFHDDDHRSQHSSCHHCSDTFIGHHDFQPTCASYIPPDGTH